jgi:O-antigen/teichoic acid export membrane protein
MTNTGTSSIARDTRWSLLSEVVRFSVGIAVFLLVARTLGRSEYGIFVAIGSIVTIIGPFANVGSSLLLLQRVRRDERDIGESFRTAFTITCVGGAVASVATVGITLAIVHAAPWLAVLIVAVGEMVCTGVVSLCAYTAMACGDLRTYSLVLSGAAAARLVAAGAFFASGSHALTAWAALQTAAAAITAGLALRHTQRRFGVIAGRGVVDRSDISDGMPYAASIAAFSAQDGIDKPLMVRYGWRDDAGLYAAAYRIPGMAFIPVQALIVATVNRSFSEGRQGIAASMRLARKLLVPSLAYSIVAATVMVVGAPLFRPLLGSEFSGSVTILRWVAFLPIVRTLQYFPANALTGAGFQRSRLVALLITLVVNLVLCVALIPHHSWRGALAATAIAEVAYAAMLWGIAGYQLRRARH